MQLFRVDRLLRNTQILGDVPDYHSLLISTIHIAWPSILESFLIALVAMVDTIMVGTIGSQAIAPSLNLSGWQCSSLSMWRSRQSLPAAAGKGTGRMPTGC